MAKTVKQFIFKYTWNVKSQYASFGDFLQIKHRTPPGSHSAVLYLLGKKIDFFNIDVSDNRKFQVSSSLIWILNCWLHIYFLNINELLTFKFDASVYVRRGSVVIWLVYWQSLNISNEHTTKLACLKHKLIHVVQVF